MADQVPVCDVLCEAMEYLVKLGSNLRLRSETLKQKRISKEKLKNTHAVKKAAKKVLMICELSRKSLENVESGVNRVLSIINTSQVSKVGGKTNNLFESPEKPHYKYFEYNKRKLKVAKRISIKHYTSVNVSANKMPKSMLDKYPIYHDCKLYRLRINSSKIEERANESPIISCNSSETSDTVMVEDRNINQSPILCIPKPSENKTEEEKNCSPNLNNTSTKLEKAVPDSLNKMQDNNSVDKSIEILDSDLSNEDSIDAKNKSSDRNSPNKVKSKRKEKLEANDEHRNNHNRDKKVGGKTATKEKITKKRRRIICHSDSDSDSGLVRSEDISEDLKENNSKNNDKHKPVKYSIDMNNQTETGNEKKKSGSIDDSMIDGSIDLDDHKANQSDSGNSKDKSGSFDCSADLNNQKANQDGNDKIEMGSQKQKPVECSIDLDNKKETQNETDKEESGSQKPILKLVNIISLLKPDLMKKDEPKREILNSKADSGDSSKNIAMKSAMKGSKSAPKRVRYEDDELFWASKRKEVAAFKPKSCSVDISRMPKITVSFLQEQNIIKVTQSGSIICEVVKDVSLGSCKKNEEPRNKENNTSLDTDDLNIVKKALLIDSDSELSEDDARKKNLNTTKKALLVDSGSESLNDDDADNVENADVATKDNNVGDKAIDSSDKSMSKDTTNTLDRQQNDEFKETAKQDNGNTTRVDTANSLGRQQNDEFKETAKQNDGNTRVDTRKSIHNKDLNDNPNEVVKGTSDSTVQSDIIKSSLLNDSSSDSSKGTKNDKESASNSSTKTSNINQNVENTNVTQGDDKTPSLNPDDIKSSLLNDSSSDNGKSSKNIVNAKSAHGSKEDVTQGDDRTPSLNPDDIKSSLLNDCSSDNGKSSKKIVNAKSAHGSKEDVTQGDDKTPSLNPDDIKSSLLNDSSRDNGKSSKNIVNAKSAHGSKEDVTQGDDKTPSLNPDDIKSSLLNDSSSDSGKSSNNIVNAKSANGSKDDVIQGDDKTPSLNPDDIKSSLLNDSSSDSGKSSNNIVNAKSAHGSKDDVIQGDDKTPSLNPDDIKSSLLNDSSSDSGKSSNNIVNAKSANGSKDDVIQGDDKTPSLNPDDIKSSLLNDSSSDSGKSSNNIVNAKSANGSKDDVIQGDDKTPSLNPDDIKSSLLNDSSSDSGKSSNNIMNAKSAHGSKDNLESIHAKKMLLTHSSNSESDDDKIKDIFKVIKESLLKKRPDEKPGRKVYTSTESEDDATHKIKKKRKKKCRKSQRDRSDEEGHTKKKSTGIDQVDGTMDELSNSSNSSKMGRSSEQPGGSTSQNSDSKEEKDIEGLTNLKSLSKTRRRRDSSDSTVTRSSSKKKVVKIPLITGEGLLEMPSNSEDTVGDDSDPNDDVIEELPEIAGLNGSDITHLAKDDLLEESDTSKTSEDKKDESESEERNVKSRRRKPHAISSDSEAGSSRPRANNNEKDSDFDDSEYESAQRTKKSKRKKLESDSGSSGNSSNEGKKKRRRIKPINDSDVSGSDTENEGRNKHGRKNIRKVMGKNQLEEATKKAARQEKERLARIAERQKRYNNLLFDESGKPDEVVVDKVILDFDPETKEPLIEIDKGLVKKLKPHQANGIKFMWDACFESVKRIKKDNGSGCILAHCMGLGKTLQVVSLTHTLLTHSELTRVERVLVVCPLSTVLNWVNEFRMWLKYSESDYEVDIYELSRYKQNSERAFQLSQWYAHGGVCVLGYEMFRNLSADNTKKFKKKMLKQFQESLVDPGPHMVVCDEGHLLKNEKTSLSQSMNRVRTLRRIVLTGTPLQNNLKEYYCMVQFVKPNLLGKYNEYLNRFVNPITNGQYTDSTEHDIRIMKRRSHVLHKMLDGAVQRRDYGVLAPFLPPKHEYVLFITLSEVQIKLYQHYLDNYSRKPLPGKSSGFLFPDFQSLQRIWTHPLVLKYNSERYEIMQQKKRDKEEEEDSEGSLADFIDDDSTPDESSTEESSDDLSDASDDSRKKKKKKSAKKSKNKVSTRRGTRANPGNLDSEEPQDNDIMEVKNENPTEWWIPMVTDDEIDDIHNSHKLVLLFEILRQCEAIGDKLLVFSQSLYSLDLIEHFLGKVDEATQEGRIDEKLGGHVGSWSPGVDYFRLDGSTSCENRSIWCKNFNREDNPRARLFLISTRAGGLGINLVAANRVIIFDVSWNPSHDVQSIFRVYRFGQKKPCYVYRFLAMGTMEEKIYERQVTKQAISKRVIDEQQIDRHYAENDLAELYKFEPRPPAPRPVPLVPKDRLFAEMLKDHDALIYKFHEHDSLLENKEEETLTEEERKAAWDDFENEKNRPPPSPFPQGWPMHNGMMPNMLAQQQQQQLAYAALATMLRKDMPNLSDDHIRSMLPLIYGANPALMQKLNDIYKYPQASPGMMNPQMMNSVMNPGAGPGMGSGGSSGLQYEPPWARDQQMRMLMQQNSMGAKYYAGGLGSRDPVAMALQQQRAREMLLGDRGASAALAAAARPRGRPPLQRPGPPRPPTTAGDVVNLADSD